MIPSLGGTETLIEAMSCRLFGGARVLSFLFLISSFPYSSFFFFCSCLLHHLLRYTLSSTSPAHPTTHPAPCYKFSHFPRNLLPRLEAVPQPLTCRLLKATSI